MADTSHLPGYEAFPLEPFFRGVEMTMEEFNALPPFDSMAAVDTRMKWSHDTFVVTKMSETQYKFERVKQ